MTTNSSEEKHEKQILSGGSASLQDKDLFGAKHKASRKISDLSDEERADLVVSFFVFQFPDREFSSGCRSHC